MWLHGSPRTSGVGTVRCAVRKMILSLVGLGWEGEGLGRTWSPHSPARLVGCVWPHNTTCKAYPKAATSTPTHQRRCSYKSSSPHTGYVVIPQHHFASPHLEANGHREYASFPGGGWWGLEKGWRQDPPLSFFVFKRLATLIVQRYGK